MQNITHSSNEQTACIKKKEAVACIWTQAFYFFKVLNTLCDTFLRGGFVSGHGRGHDAAQSVIRP